MQKDKVRIISYIQFFAASRNDQVTFAQLQSEFLDWVEMMLCASLYDNEWLSFCPIYFYRRYPCFRCPLINDLCAAYVQHERVCQ